MSDGDNVVHLNSGIRIMSPEECEHDTVFKRVSLLLECDASEFVRVVHRKTGVSAEATGGDQVDNMKNALNELLKKLGR